MNPDIENPRNGNAACSGAASNAEGTLRLIASLRAPEGLEDRIHEALHAAPRRGRVLAWPGPFKGGHAWMRAVAAAALAFVVAGGGWSVYLRVQPRLPAKAIRLGPHPAAPGSFEGASAMRTPQTLNGPVLTHPVKAHILPGKNAKKASEPAGQQPDTGKKAAVQTAAAPAK